MKGYKDGSGKFHPTEKKNGVSKSRDQNAKTQGIRLARMEKPLRVGKGSKIELKKQFGLKDIKVGAIGTVKEHFGKDRDRPIVEFEGHQGQFVLDDPSVFTVIKGTSKFDAKNKDVFEVKGSKEEILQKIRGYGKFENITPDGWFSGSIYLDDGEGRSGYAVYRGKITDGQVQVIMNKNDIPKRWRDDIYYEQLFEEASSTVKDALGISD